MIYFTEAASKVRYELGRPLPYRRVRFVFSIVDFIVIFPVEEKIVGIG